MSIETDPMTRPWLDAAQNVATRLLGYGMLSASLVASVASLVPRFAGWSITSNPTVQEALIPLAPYLWMGAFFWAPVAVGEGVLLAKRELKFLATVYLLSTALLPPALLRVKHDGQGTVQQVWAGFCAFQLFRAAAFTTRIWGEGWLRRLGLNKKVSSEASSTTTRTDFNSAAVTTPAAT